VLAIAAGIAYAWHSWPATVQVALATRGQAIEAVYATGVVEPSVQIPVAPRAGGRLVSLEVGEGAQVRKGQPLARLEGLDLDQTVQEMGARERLARQQYERTQTLVQEKFLSPAELDRTHTELQASQAALRRAEAVRDYNRLVAPADGVVIRRDGERGQFVPAGQAVYTLACCEPLRVAAEVDEEDIARVHIGMPVAMRGDALPGQLFDGEVAEITPKGDPISRSYRVRIHFKDGHKMDVLGSSGVRSGMTMDANLIVSRQAHALLVPTQALRGTHLWVLAEGRLHGRQVRVGIKGSERSQILEGLQEGEAVVLAPDDTLREGQRAKVSTPAPSPTATAASR